MLLAFVEIILARVGRAWDAYYAGEQNCGMHTKFKIRVVTVIC